MARKKIPEKIKLQLWVKSAGRCEFKGCNKSVWYNELTLSAGNFAEVAHIIGSSKDGPRGTDKSEDYQIDFSNLMLLCQRCHKEIDDNPNNYSIKTLRQWKKEHENRIEIQTSFPEDIHKSSVMVFNVNIGTRIVPINFESIRNAMFPKYPSDLKGIKISEIDFDRFSPPEQWQWFANTKIKRKVKRALEEGINDKKIKHLSIFGIAPMPLLIYLGFCIGDTISCNIFQSHRNISNTNKTWNWQKIKAPKTNYIVTCEKEGKGDIVLLKLAISDILSHDKYQSIVSENCSIYQITVPEPSPHFLKTSKQLELFSYEYRKLLNVIQAKHGRESKIFLLPAIPVAMAIECGRVIIPTKDSIIHICEYYKNNNGYTKVLSIQ